MMGQLYRYKYYKKLLTPNEVDSLESSIIKMSLDETIISNSQSNMLYKVLKFLQGKKNIIAGIITTTSAFLALKGLITTEDATYINAMSLILFGSASIATGRMLKK